jgi:hypothetical protein
VPRLKPFSFQQLTLNFEPLNRERLLVFKPICVHLCESVAKQLQLKLIFNFVDNNNNLFDGINGIYPSASSEHKRLNFAYLLKASATRLPLQGTSGQVAGRHVFFLFLHPDHRACLPLEGKSCQKKLNIQ